jgi:hypothetical protein
MLTVMIVAIAMAVLFGRIGRYRARRYGSDFLMMGGPFHRRRMRRFRFGGVLMDARGDAGTGTDVSRREPAHAADAAPRTDAGGAAPARFETPLESLQRRFAAGELGVDEYEHEVGRLYGVKEN